MNIHCRLAGTEDVKHLLRMMEAFYLIDQYPFDKALTRENLMDFIQNPYLGRLWMVEGNEQVVGYLVLSFDFSFEFKGRNAMIDEFYIEKDYRNQGIGSQMLHFVLEEAKKLNLRAVHLEVERHNETGKKLYSKFNFKDHNRYLLTRYIT